jgi:GNAT superfamily N-acetyltransferase
MFERVYQAPGFRRYVARWDGQLAGVGSLRVDAGIAQLCGAATLPAFRRRGVQTALLARRLDDARRQGCDLATVTTAPGSKSQENAQRQGFALLYTRALLVKPPDGGGR